jgi:hypothetical protein
VAFYDREIGERWAAADQQLPRQRWQFSMQPPFFN